MKARPAVAAEKRADEGLAMRLERELDCVDWHFTSKPGADPFKLLLLGMEDEFGTAGTLLFARALAPRFPERAREELRWKLPAKHNAPATANINNEK